MIETIKNLICDECGEYLEQEIDLEPITDGIKLRRLARSLGWVFLHGARYATKPGDYCRACVDLLKIEELRHEQYRGRKTRERQARAKLKKQAKKTSA